MSAWVLRASIGNSRRWEFFTVDRVFRACVFSIILSGEDIRHPIDQADLVGGEIRIGLLEFETDLQGVGGDDG